MLVSIKARRSRRAIHIGFAAVFCTVLLRSTDALPPLPFSDAVKSLTDVAGGVLQTLPKAFPGQDAFFSASKNLLAGYPVEIVLNAVNLFCSSAMSAQAIRPKQTPAIEAMNFVLMTRDQNESIPLREAQQLWSSPLFNVSRPTAVLVTGWTSNINKSNSAMSQVYAAYMCRGGVNFVAIDTAEFVDTLYEWSAFNTEEIGKLLADALVNLTSTYPVHKIHLVGHSLGAHIVGSAARYYQEQTGVLLPRVTGLDPANPCFNEGGVLTGLSRGDAQYVDVIHSNPGALGKRDPLGDVDFYPNGLDPLPPGCMSIGCAHGRAYEYYAESVYPGNENTFKAVKCHSLFALNTGFCKGKKHPMGFATPTTLKGNYFLKTNEESPFGEGSTVPADVKCNAEDGQPME